MFNSHQDELHRFLSWRRKTRFIRHHGGPLLAFALCIIGILFVWHACTHRFNQENNRLPEASQAWQIKLPDHR